MRAEPVAAGSRWRAREAGQGRNRGVRIELGMRKGVPSAHH